MRPGQQNKRGRGRNSGGNNRKGQNPLSRTYDSSGPDVKIRGTAQTIADKYLSLARDAQSAGDRVMAENYLQHAEHYNRIIAAAQAQLQERSQRDDRDSRDDRDFNSRDDDSDSDSHNRAEDEQAARSRNDEAPVEGKGESDEGSRQENRRRRPRQERAAVDPDAPQPVIEGVPAEVALEQENGAEAAADKAPSRRRGRPRRTKASEGDDGATASSSGRNSESSAEAAPAE